MGKRRIVTFELRAGKDDDLHEALEKIDPQTEDRSDVLRRALRAFFGLGGVSTRVRTKNLITEVRESFPDELRLPLEKVESGDPEDALDNLLGSY